MAGHYDDLHASHAAKRQAVVDADQAAEDAMRAGVDLEAFEVLMALQVGELPANEVPSAQRWQLRSASDAVEQHSLLAMGFEPFAATGGNVMFRKFGV